MFVERFDWDDANVNHIARHDIVPDEVEEIFISKYYLFRSRSSRYIVLGRTAEGRYLTCVFEKGDNPGLIRVVTARDMDHKERTLFKRKVR